MACRTHPPAHPETSASQGSPNVTPDIFLLLRAVPLALKASNALQEFGFCQIFLLRQHTSSLASISSDGLLFPLRYLALIYISPPTDFQKPLATIIAVHLHNLSHKLLRSLKKKKKRQKPQTSPPISTHSLTQIKTVCLKHWILYVVYQLIELFVKSLCWRNYKKKNKSILTICSKSSSLRESSSVFRLGDKSNFFL